MGTGLAGLQSHQSKRCHIGASAWHHVYMNDVLHLSPDFSDGATQVPARTYCLPVYPISSSCNLILTITDLPLGCVVSMLITRCWLCWLFCFCNT